MSEMTYVLIGCQTLLTGKVKNCSLGRVYCLKPVGSLRMLLRHQLTLQDYRCVMAI